MSVVNEAMDRFGLRKRKKVLGMPIGRKQTDWRKVAGIGAGAGAAGAAGVAGKKAMGRSQHADEKQEESSGTETKSGGDAETPPNAGASTGSNGAIGRLLKRPGELLHKGEDALESVKQVGDRTSDVSQAVSGESSMFGKAKAALQAFGGDGEGGDEKKQRLIIQEQIDVAVPADVAYDAWTDFEEFDEIFRAVQQVEVEESGGAEEGGDSQESGTETQWQAKILFSSRQWTSEITDQRPGERIAWTTSGDVDHLGAVSFHPLGDRLTRIHLEMEYHPTGLVEKFGNLFLTVRHRVRKDLRLFKHHLELQGTGGDEEGSSGREASEDRSAVSDDARPMQSGDEDDESASESPSEAASREDDGQHRSEDGGEPGGHRSTSPRPEEGGKTTQRSISP